jgi:hypothetical protein
MNTSVQSQCRTTAARPRSRTKVETREWTPTFIGGNSPFKKLADDRWETIAEMVRDECKEPPDPDFRKGIDVAIEMYHSTQAGSDASLPKAVRGNLARANRATADLLAAFHGLDGNSRNLLAEVLRPRRDRRTLFARGPLLAVGNLLLRLHDAIQIAETEAAKYPTTRAGLKDHARISMGYFLAVAFRQFIGESYITETRPALYAEVYQEVMGFILESAGKSARNKDLRKSIRAAVELYRNTDPFDNEQNARMLFWGRYAAGKASHLIDENAVE